MIQASKHIVNSSPFEAEGIIVIADDFTGAAELAGIALRYGLQLNVCLQTNTIQKLGKDGLVINTDSRSMQKQNALAVTEHVFKQVAKHDASLVYKKIDSVLRGYVIDELKIQMQILGLQKAIIAPANPTLGRTIEQGKYLINGAAINTTGFANDPEFPATSSLVKEMLQNEVDVLEHSDTLPEYGIVVAATSTNDDVKAWANKIDKRYALAGAGDFFMALLAKQYQEVEQEEAVLQQPFLYVAGSAFETARARVQQWKQDAINVITVQTNFELIQVKQDHFVLAIQDNVVGITASALREGMAIVAKQLMAELGIQELFIEGGSTAASVLAALDITVLTPINELSRGVVRMKTNELFVTVKPGSYALNEKILAHR